MPLPILLLVLGIWILLALVLQLFAMLILYKGSQRLWARYRTRRRVVFQGAVEGLILEREVPPGALRPALWGDSRIIEDMLIDVMRDVRGPLRASISKRAESMGLVDFWLKRLGRGSLHARARALERLGNLHSTKAVPTLLEELASGGPTARRVAAGALGRIGDPQALPGLVRALHRERGTALRPICRALAVFGRAAAPLLVSDLDRRQPGNSRVIEILGDIHALEAVPVLIRLLDRDGDPEIRRAAAAALGKLAHPEALEVLLAGLKDRFREVRVQCAWALGRIGDPAACPALEACLEDSYWWVGIRAAEALAGLGAQGRRSLERCRERPEPYLRDLASEMLSREEHAV